ERATGNVVQTNLVAELYGRRIAAVLAADTALQIRTGRAAFLDRHLYQLAYAGLIQSREGIGLVDLCLVVSVQELAGIIAGEAECHLGQVVGTEGEELRLLGNRVGRQSRARDLDHGTDVVLHVGAFLFLDLLRRLYDN